MRPRTRPLAPPRPLPPPPRHPQFPAAPHTPCARARMLPPPPTKLARPPHFEQRRLAAAEAAARASCSGRGVGGVGGGGGGGGVRAGGMLTAAPVLPRKHPVGGEGALRGSRAVGCSARAAWRRGRGERKGRARRGAGAARATVKADEEAGVAGASMGGGETRGDGQLVCTNGQSAWEYHFLHVSATHTVTPAMVGGLRTAGYDGESTRPLLVRKVGGGAQPIGVCVCLDVGDGGGDAVLTLRRPWDDTVGHLVARMNSHLQRRRDGSRRAGGEGHGAGGAGNARGGGEGGAPQARAHKTSKEDAAYVRRVKGDAGMSGEEQAVALKAYFKAKVMAEREEHARRGDGEGGAQIALYAPGAPAGWGAPGAGVARRGKRIGEEALVREVLVEGAILEVNGVEYIVRVNTPVASAPHTLGVDTIVGCPLTPAVACEFCAEGGLEWRWSRARPGEGGRGEERVEVVGQRRTYTPTTEDIGSVLRVAVRPPDFAGTGVMDVYPLGEDGAGFETRFERPVGLPAGSRAPVLNRIAALERMAQRCAPDSIRVMSYNVLADSLNSINKSLFPYTPPRILSREYRLPILAAEITDFDADLVLLQEIDLANWERFWAVHFRERGFAGFFTPKTGLDSLDQSVGDGEEPMTRTGSEGCAMLWRESKLRMVDTRDISFCEASVSALEGRPWGSRSADETTAPCRRWVSDFVKVLPNLERVLKGVSSVAQLAVLQPVVEGEAHQGRRLVVTNSHFFYHKDACHVRAIQAKMLVDEVERTIEEIHRESPDAQVGLCVAGDFNAKRQSLAMDFLLDSVVMPSRKRWADCAHFSWNVNVTFDEGAPMLDTSPNSSQSLKMRMRNMTVDEAMAYANLALEENERGNPSLLNDAIKHYKRAHRRLHPTDGMRNHRFMRKKERQLLKALRDNVARAGFRHAAVNRTRDLGREMDVGQELPEIVEAASDRREGDAMVVGLGLHLSHGLDLKLAGEPLSFTNWNRGFRESIDWILIGNKELLCKAWAPSPVFSADDLHESGLPSGTFPSDHISVVAQLEWRTSEGAVGSTGALGA